MIYTADHRPQHVHVFYAGASVVIDLNDLTTRDRRGMKPHDVRAALEIVYDNREFLLSEWDRINPTL